MTTKTLTASQDTWTRSDRPSSTAGADSARLALAAGTRVSFLHVSLPTGMKGLTITSATLRLRSYAMPAGTRTLTVRRAQSRPYLSRLSWANQPAGITGPGEPKTATKSGALAGQTVWEFDVQSHIQAVADGQPWYGWRIESSEAVLRWFYGSGAAGSFADCQPELELSWADEPDPPSELTPSGNLAVSVAKPVLRFTHVDLSGDTTLEAIHVQVAADEDFTVGVWDSGEANATDPELRLEGTTYPGLADGGKAFWRARAKDGDDLWSGWSDVAEFRRVTKGTLTMVEPPAEVISDPTPVVSWTFAGRSQRAYRVTVALVANPSRLLYDTGKLTGTTTSLEIPEKVFRFDDRNYRVSVYVWDWSSRITTPGDVTAVVVRRDVHFDDDAAIVPVTNLKTKSQLPTPDVQLDWSRSSTPDKWFILRDGEIIASPEPDETATSPGALTHRFVDGEARPHVDHRYQVAAIAGGRRSANNSVSVIRTVPEDIWLTTATDRVRITTSEDQQVSLGEVSSQHDVGERVVVVTSALRGYEGSVSGRLFTDVLGSEGVTAQQWRDRLVAIRRAPGGARLAISDLNIPVSLSNISVSPSSELDEELSFVVGFNFWQRAEVEDYT